jgi:CBS domain-containing protein
MLAELKVGELMTRDVVSVLPEAKVSEAKAVMKEFGILTETDIFNKLSALMEHELSHA